MGSRYGGLKQIDPVGSQGEAILDYSLFDAYQAGFETAVIIIKEAIREEFMQTVGKRLEKCPMEIRYAYQELDKLPAGYAAPEGRTKPWGTCHAVLCAGDAIDGAPFAVVNADDYYGKSAFRVVYDYLLHAADGEKYDYCMVGYQLGNTVTDHGSVARGVCVTENGLLTAITERTRIEKRPEGIAFTEDGENWHILPPETPVSMNLWGYTSSFLAEIESRMAAFLEKALAENPNKGEFYLPMLVSDLLQENKARVTVLHSPDKWYGVTYAADRPQVMAAIAQMTKEGKYPDGLWK
jgi:NDP-sugar pyrophosphorylase family protein